MNETPVFKFAIEEGLENIGFSFLPKRAHETDTGWDVRAAESFILRAGQYAKIPLGFRVLAPKGYWLELRPRSSSFAKKKLHCLYGVIDESYEGKCIFACQYIPDVSSIVNDLKIEIGEAIGQIIPIKRQEMKVETVTNEEYETLCKERNSSRGDGGFGSTNK
jgi:dUTP pyrophosphatase